MLLIDAANVVGSRPTGWWKDRAGAARLLVDQLRTAVRDARLHEPVTLVPADRDLAQRVQSSGAKIVGPRWLLDELDASS